MAATGMRWTTAVGVVVAGVEAHIHRKAQEATDARNLLFLLKRIAPPGERENDVPVAAATKPRGKAPAKGTIPDRVLEVVGSHDEPVAKAVIVTELPTSPAHHIQKAIAALIAEGRLVATGATTTRRFSLPRKKAR